MEENIKICENCTHEKVCKKRDEIIKTKVITTTPDVIAIVKCREYREEITPPSGGSSVRRS